jgi:hypothetical protein
VTSLWLRRLVRWSSFVLCFVRSCVSCVWCMIEGVRAHT